MQNVQTLKSKGQEQLSHLAENVKEVPGQTKTWGVTAGAAAAGALGLAAVGGLLASTPVALTVGAVAGGWLGWKYAHERDQPEAVRAAEKVEPAVQSVAVEEEATTAAVPTAVAEDAETTPAGATGTDDDAIAAG